MQQVYIRAISLLALVGVFETRFSYRHLLSTKKIPTAWPGFLIFIVDYSSAALALAKAARIALDATFAEA